MISTLLRISRISLSRDRVAQTMTFVLPIAFFSIFAMVFGRQSMSSMPRIRVAVVDEDRSKMSRALIAAMKTEESLRIQDSVAARGAAAQAPPVALDRARAAAQVRAGDFPVAVIFPAGWGETFPSLTGRGMPVDVLADPSDPVAKQVFIGLLQRSAARVMRAGMSQWQGGEAAAATTGAPGQASAGLDAAAPGEPPGQASGGSGSHQGRALSPGATPGHASAAPDPLALVPSRVTDVVGDRKQGNARMVSFYAAGIAVMFLLFSCSAAGGSLLDEQDSGTLERVLNTRVGMTGLLAGKWLHLTLLGLMQITVMFLWGMVAFGLDLFGHVPGFLIMTVATAAAAAGFGLLLATLCSTRQQLGGLSTLVILVMSAMGGSMFPRFLMTETMQKVGLVTFNAWALDGYIKVFWRETPLLELWPQVLVLVTLTAAFLTVARLMARRWERA